MLEPKQCRTHNTALKPSNLEHNASVVACVSTSPRAFAYALQTALGVLGSLGLCMHAPCGGCRAHTRVCGCSELRVGDSESARSSRPGHPAHILKPPESEATVSEQQRASSMLCRIITPLPTADCKPAPPETRGMQRIERSATLGVRVKEATPS